ncbi:hypothetical protein ElyMa_000723800 [Elysia marginata]|uniref:Uncharacterized protein n=1 Tax=Elysia marginata TaxID=1093978 RepID=A0AAV4GMQ6_9GAST|nr:hypothetical protein ElyMa_000723800 [Elysia marginata]
MDNCTKLKLFNLLLTLCIINFFLYRFFSGSSLTPMRAIAENVASEEKVALEVDNVPSIQNIDFTVQTDKKSGGTEDVGAQTRSQTRGAEDLGTQTGSQTRGAGDVGAQTREATAAEKMNQTPEDKTGETKQTSGDDGKAIESTIKKDEPVGDNKIGFTVGNNTKLSFCPDPPPGLSE